MAKGSFRLDDDPCDLEDLRIDLIDTDNDTDWRSIIEAANGRAVRVGDDTGTTRK